MSEEIMQNEATQAESMADYEAHFDDANPWNVVKGYMDNKTRLHIKIEGHCKWRCNCHGRRAARIHPCFQNVPLLH